MVDEDSHSTDLCLGWRSSFNNFIGSLHFWFLLRTKLFINAGYAAKLHKMLWNLTFVVQVACFRIRPKKVSVLFRATFEQLSLQKATFVCFLSNFLRNYGKHFEKSWVASGKPNLSVTHFVSQLHRNLLSWLHTQSENWAFQGKAIK